MVHCVVAGALDSPRKVPNRGPEVGSSLQPTVRRCELRFGLEEGDEFRRRLLTGIERRLELRTHRSSSDRGSRLGAENLRQQRTADGTDQQRADLIRTQNDRTDDSTPCKEKQNLTQRLGGRPSPLSLTPPPERPVCPPLRPSRHTRDMPQSTVQTKPQSTLLP